MAEPKVLLYDLETSLQPVAVFQLANNDWIHPENILQERYIICASWQWLGDKTVHSVSVLDDPKLYDKDPHNDKFVCETLHEVLAEADVVVTHNGDSFDNKYVKTRMLFHGLDPLPPVTTIDTYKLAKSKFNFNSNKLDYIARFLGLGKKLHTSAGLWLKVLSGNRGAIKEMVEYNKQDVIVLNKVFTVLRPYFDNHVNRGLFGEVGCPRCGSKKIQSRGYHRAISRVYRRFQCQSCAGWFRSVLNDKSVKVTTRVL